MSDDSVRIAFNQGQRGTTFRLSLGRRLSAFPEYLLKQDDIPVALVRGKEIVCGGEHFAVIPLLPADWEQQQAYRHRPDNVPYWDGERRLQRLDVLLYNLSTSMRIPEALDDAVDAEDDEFFAGIPEVVYTRQHLEQLEDYPLPKPIEWEPEPETPEPAGMAPEDYPLLAGMAPEDYPLPVPIEWEPEPEAPEPAGLSPDEYLASKQPPSAKIYPWTFWYRGGDGAAHQVIIEATYEDAQRAWDKLSTIFDMTSKRP